MEMGWRGLRIILRSLRRDPTYSATTLLTMAVVVAANASSFGVLFGVLYRPLPYDAPDRVAQLWTSNEARGVDRWGVSLHDVADWRETTSSFSALGAYAPRQGNLTTGEEPVRVGYSLAQPDLLHALGVGPARGRLFTPEEDLPGGDRVVLLSHGFWESAFGGDPGVVGRTLVLDGVVSEIVGVMPEGFYFPDPTTQLWKPFGMVPADEGGRGGRWVSAVGRLAPGVSYEQAQAEMESIGRRLAETFPESNEGMGGYVEPRHAFVSAGSGAMLWTTLGVVGLITLIACANVANLTLARGARRQAELAVRSSLGAGRGRLMGQVWAEGLVVGTAGGLLGVALGRVILQWLRSVEGTGLPRLADVRLGPEAILYSTAITLLCCVLFSLVPALRIGRGDLAASLRSRRNRPSRLREALVVGELALSLSVLVGAGLLVRSLMAMAAVDPGYESENRLAVRISPSWTEYPERSDAQNLYRTVLNGIRGLPGVESVAMINDLPLRGSSRWNTQAFTVAAEDASAPDRPGVFYRSVTAGYFETLGIPVMSGRSFDEMDGADSELVAVVSREAARSLWPDEPAVGQELWFVPPDHPAHAKIRVVGVVGDVQDVTATREPAALVYLPFPQAQWGHFQDWGMSLVLHARSDPLGLVEGVRSALREADPTLPLFEIQTLEARAESDLAPSRFQSRVIGGLGLVGWLLAGIGVFGVMSYMVGQRTGEIGMRMALGSTRSSVARLFLTNGLRLACLGVLFGLAGGYVVARWVESLLFRVGPLDLATYALVALSLLLTAVAACVAPAVRASMVDPVRCLKED